MVEPVLCNGLPKKENVGKFRDFLSVICAFSTILSTAIT